MQKLKRVLLSILAVVLIIEEWLWDVLTYAGAHISRLLHLEAFDRWLVHCSPGMALLAFLIPIVLVAPINLLGLVLLWHGLFLRGLMVEIFAKLLGTLLLARVFKLTKSQLLTFRWLSYVYFKVLGWLTWAHTSVVNTAVYRFSQQMKEKIRQRMRLKG